MKFPSLEFWLEKVLPLPWDFVFRDKFPVVGYDLNLGGSGHYVTVGKDVTLVELGDQISIVAALREGRIDGMTMSPPVSRWARSLGFKELVDFSNLDVDFQLAGLVSTRSYVAAHEDVIRGLTKACWEAVRLCKLDRKCSFAALRRYTEMEDEEALERAYHVFSKVFPDPPYPNVKGIQAVIDAIAATDPRAREASPEDFIDLRFVHELEKR